MGRLKGGVLALTAAALLAAGSAAPALAQEAGSSWTFENLKVRGAASKVGAIKADGAYNLDVDESDGGFEITQNGALVFSGTGSDDETGRITITGVDAASFGAFVAAKIEQSPTGVKKHVDVTDVSVEMVDQQPKITSSTRVTETWDSLDLNLGIKISFLYTATVDGPKGTRVTLTNATGSLTLNGKATDPDAGTATTLAGSAWELGHAYTISIPGVGTLKDNGAATLYLGPNGPEGLTEGQCLLVSDNGNRVFGTWAAGAKPGAIGITLDPTSMGEYLYGKLLDKADEEGATITAFELKATTSSAKVKAEEPDALLTLTAKATFAFTASLGGGSRDFKGTFNFKAFGPRR